MILSIDTAFGPIGVALVSAAGETIAHEVVADALGAQAEKLPPLVQRMFSQAGLQPAALRRIAVSVGPGAFTGVRVGLAFAKGLALALKIPLLGYTTLACLAAQAKGARGGAGAYASVIDARRGEYYAQGFDGTLETVFGPGVMTGVEVQAALARMKRPLALAGSGAGMIGARDAEVLDVQTIDARQLALMALHADPALHPPVPCYLRAPDARLPS